MERTVAEYIQMCEWDPARFLIFSDNVFGVFIYYSHLLPLIVSLIFALFIFFKNPKLLSARWLLRTAILLSLWLFFDLILWATEKPEFTMFFWSLVNMIEPMIYASILFFIYAFIDGRSMPFKQKLVVLILLAPTVILASTSFNLSFYDLTNCWREAIEGPLPYYSYFVETVFVLWILLFGMRRFVKNKNPKGRVKTILTTIAAVFFLLSFAMGNVIGSLLVNWEIGQYGLLSIPIFMAALAYLIVKYNAFNVKVISTQIIVSALWLLTLGILFLRNIATVRVVAFATLVSFTFLGYALIRSVKREVEQKEKMEELAEELQTANKGQANLLHFINHQIKGYLSKSRIIFSELRDDPDYGPMPEQAKPLIDEGFNSLTEGTNFVQQILKGSNIEKGVIGYDMKPTDFRGLVSSVAEEMKEPAQKKGLEYKTEFDDGDYQINGDEKELREAVKNFIDNSIKYTPSGSISLKLSKQEGKVLFSVKDTGIGMSDETKEKLFTKGGRGKDSQKINIYSTGFGLSIVKGIIEAHKGRVWAESDGEGKGSAFYMELPVS